MIDFIKKTCYISIPVIFAAILVIIKFIFNISVNSEKVECMIGIIGTLIGFLLTAITIFTSLPKKNIVMKRAIKFNHHIIFSKCILLGIFFCVVTILFWLININVYFIYLFFIMSFLETIMAAWYIYKFCLFSIE